VQVLVNLFQQQFQQSQQQFQQFQQFQQQIQQQFQQLTQQLLNQLMQTQQQLLNLQNQAASTNSQSTQSQLPQQQQPVQPPMDIAAPVHNNVSTDALAKTLMYENSYSRIGELVKRLNNAQLDRTSFKEALYLAQYFNLIEITTDGFDKFTNEKKINTYLQLLTQPFYKFTGNSYLQLQDRPDPKEFLLKEILGSDTELQRLHFYIGHPQNDQANVWFDNIWNLSILRNIHEKDVLSNNKLTLRIQNGKDSNK
jgi:hypothetical protein